MSPQASDRTGTRQDYAITWGAGRPAVPRFASDGTQPDGQGRGRHRGEQGDRSGHHPRAGRGGCARRRGIPTRKSRAGPAGGALARALDARRPEHRHRTGRTHRPRHRAVRAPRHRREQRGRSAAATRGLSLRHGRGLDEHLHAQLLRGAAHDERRTPPPAEAQYVVHRHDQLRQRLPPRSSGHRLLRCQGRTGQPVQGAVEGVRSARRSRQHGQSRAGGNRPVAGRRRRGGHAGEGARDAGRGHPGRGRVAVRDREVHPAARGGRPRAPPRKRSHLERHRRRLRHRRRPHHHPLSETSEQGART